MSKFINIQIPNACHEDWNSMTPESKGRFCNSCQKKVVDFTQMSDKQLIDFFKQSSTSTCGRFLPEQLERDILIPKKKIPWFKYFIHITLPAFLFSLKSMAQVTKIKEPVEVISVVDTVKKSPITLGRLVVKSGINVTGLVRDETGQPLPHASVMIKGSNRGVATDISGSFTLNNVEAPAVLVISSVGFETQEIRVKKNDQPLNIQLTMQMAVAGEVVVVGYFTTKKTTKPKVIKEKKAEKINPELTIYPNPVISSAVLNLKYKGLEAGNYLIEIYTTNGLLIQSEKKNIENTTAETSLKLNKLLAGNYYVRLSNEKNGKQVSQQFIISD